MENIKEFPREYTDQVISLSPSDGWVERAPGPSFKLQASSTKRCKLQAASFEPQAASFKLQAASYKLCDP